MHARSLHFPARGLYVLTPESATDVDRLVEQVQAALTGGAKAVQYREKSAAPRTRLASAAALATLCRDHGVPLIINDDAELALRVAADGVHVGKDDMSPARVRPLLGDDAIIGASCYASLDRAVAAVAEGANYVAFGSFFPSRTKPNAVPCPRDVLGAAAAALDVPIVAIGGITPDNAAALISAGANVVAVSHAVFGAGDVRGNARSFARLF